MNDRVKQKKVVLGILLIGLVIAFIYIFNNVNDGGHQSTTSEVKVEQKPVLEQLFERFAENNTYYRDVLQNDTIKQEIIKRYGQKYYDCIVKNCETNSPVKKVTDENGSYYFESNGWKTYSCGIDGSTISYDPESTSLKVTLKIDGYEIGTDGNVKLEPKGSYRWRIFYEQNEFNEMDENKPFYIQTLIRNNKEEYNDYLQDRSLILQIFKNGIISLNINLLVDSGGFTKILLRNDDFGKKVVMNIPIPTHNNDQVFFGKDSKTIYLIDGEIISDFLSYLYSEDLNLSLAFVSAGGGENMVFSFNTSKETKGTYQIIGRYFKKVKAF